MTGIMDKGYHNKRKNRIDLIYRLNRRTHETKCIIEKHFDKSKINYINCLDIGVADGLMLSRLNNIFKFNKAIGIDMSEELIKLNKDRNITLEIGNAENLHFDNDTFDVIVACAVIEHINNPNDMLSECYRVLKKDGILIITTPNPFHDKIATKIGYFKEDDHTETLNIKRLNKLFISNKFNLIDSKYFMFFPFFKLPFENQIESFIRFIGLGKIMSNQIIIGRK
ncbi:MAG: class I SAM-dependent methyltransferase [Candidatus Woesearchaeota archaeon]